MNRTFPNPRNSTNRFSPKNRLLILLLTFLGGFKLAAQDCANDTQPPIAVCQSELFVSLTVAGDAEIEADIFDLASSDNCGIASLLAKRSVDGTCDDDAMPDPFAPTVKFCCNDIGSAVEVTLRVQDTAGNFTDCFLPVMVEDKIKPVCAPPANVTVDCTDFDATLATYGDVQTSDNCAVDSVDVSVDNSQFNNLCTSGIVTRTFKVYDASGNSSQCTQRITLGYVQSYYIRFPNDTTLTFAGQGNYGEPLLTEVDCEIPGISYSDQIFTIVQDAAFKIERLWTIINWCTYNADLPCIYVDNPNPSALPYAIENQLGPTISPNGTSGIWAPTQTALVPGGPIKNYADYWVADANCYQYKQVIKVLNENPGLVQGTVFSDTLANCQADAGEPALAGWQVKITGLTTGFVYETATDANGFYSQNIFGNDTIVEVTLAAPTNFGQGCQTTYSVNLASGQPATLDLPVHLETGCPLMTVDIAAPQMRRCFNNSYSVNYTNLSAQTIDNVRIEVQLDPDQTYISSTQAATALGGNLFSFDIGTLAAGQGGNFHVYFNLSCDAPLGATHCAEAHIYPDSLCSEDNNWKGSNIEAEVLCDQDSVRFFLKNTGPGAMPNTLEYVVVEDVIMYRQGSFQLGAGQTLTLDAMPAKGSTWRLESPQQPGHPFGGLAASALEGCGGINTQGLVTMLPLDAPNPFEAIDCQQNRGSYDPNDKQAEPSGFGAQHLIAKNTDIEYRIRFQNTGTDTAFRVVILDTLSTHLDAASVRPGAASHAYDFALLDGNVLRFTFDNILLPDSNVNEAASHGFVSFRTKQRWDNPDGTFINGRAAIYFDFNEPVITNEVFHTVGTGFVVSAVQDGFSSEKLHVYPNPSNGAMWFDLPDDGFIGKFRLTDVSGKTLRTAQVSGKQFRFDAAGLRAGTYFYVIEKQGVATYSGKISVSH